MNLVKFKLDVFALVVTGLFILNNAGAVETNDNQSTPHYSDGRWISSEAVELGVLTPKQQELALTNSNYLIRRAAVKQGNLTPIQFDRALTDEDWSVRYSAVKIGNLTDKQRERAFHDYNRAVRNIAHSNIK